MNGGLIQPGCVLPPIDEVNINSIADLGKVSVDGNLLKHSEVVTLEVVLFMFFRQFFQ